MATAIIGKNDFDDMLGSRRKLTWVSREDHERNCASDSGVGDVFPSIQKDSPRPAKCTSRILESPARGGHIRTESPARKGESVRRIRKDRHDIDLIEKASSNLFASRRDRLGIRSLLPHPAAGSIKGDLVGVVTSEHNLVKPGRIAHYHTMTKDFEEAQKVWPAAGDSPTKKSGDSPESFRMVVSYLAEETDRIINARTLLNLRSNSVVTAQLQSNGTDQETSSDALLRNGGRRQGPASLLESPFLTYESTNNTPSSGSTRAMSATMKAYLESRRVGTTMGSQILPTNNKPAAAPGTHSSTESASNLSAPANKTENSSSSNKIGIGRFDHFNAPRAALSPLNGNEDVLTHSTPPSSIGSKMEHSVAGLGEGPESRRGRDFNASSLQKEDHGFSQRFQHRAKPVSSNGTETASNKDKRTNLSTTTATAAATKQARDRPSPVRVREEKDVITVSQSLWQSTNGVATTAESRRVDSHVRHPSARGHSQRIGEPGKSLFSERALGVGSNNGASRRRSQSCRRDSISTDINPLHLSGEEDEALPRIKTATTFMLNTISSDDKSKFSTTRLQPVNIPASIGQPLPSLRESITLKEQFSIVADEHDDPMILPNDSTSVDTKVIDKNSLSESRHNNTSERIAIPQVARPKMWYTMSQSFDQDIYSKLSVKTRKDNNCSYTGYTDSTSSSSMSRGSSTNSPSSAKSRSSFPASHLHKWLVNQFKLGTKSKTSKDLHVEQNPDEQQQQRIKKRSPWKSRPGEILQVLTRKKGSKGSAVPAAGAPLLDLQGLQNLRYRTSGIENGSQSPLSRNGLVDARMMDAGNDFTPHRRSLDPQQQHHGMMQHGNVEAGNNCTPPRHSLDAHHYRMMQMENGGGYSIPSHRMMDTENGGGLSTPSYRMMLIESGVGPWIPSHRKKQKENGGALSTPSHRLMDKENSSGQSTPAHRMMDKENGGGQSIPAHRMMPMENSDGLSTPSYQILHKENGGLSTPSHRLIQKENGGYSTPSHRLMHMEAVGISTPSRRMTTHLEQAGSISTPSRRMMHMESLADDFTHRKAYVLPPIPSSFPPHSQGLQNLFSAEGRAGSALK